jgi:hypothetical protein
VVTIWANHLGTGCAVRIIWRRWCVRRTLRHVNLRCAYIVI